MRLSSSCAFLILSFSALPATDAATVRFRNTMNTTADVQLVPRSGAPLPRSFSVAGDREVEFTFDDTQERFDILVKPRDKPGTGAPQADVNLLELSQQSVDGVIRLNGKFGPGEKVLVCCKRRRKCRCYWSVTQGERIAIGLSANLKDGTQFNIESEIVPY